MKILYLTDVFPPECGGSGWSVYFFARALREKGHTVEVISLDGPERNYGGVPVRGLSLSPGKTPFFSNREREVRDVPRIAAMIKNTAAEYDFVHGHHKFSSLIASMLDRPFYVTLRDYWPICMCARSKFRTHAVCGLRDFTLCSADENILKGVAAPFAYSWFSRRMSRNREMISRASTIFVISHYLKQQFAPSLPESLMHVLPNFSDAEDSANKFAETPNQKYMVYVGKLEKHKGADLLPEILRRTKTRLPLVVVGDGSLKQQLKEKLGDRAQFKGYCDHPEMLKIVSGAEFLIFPSTWAEPLGRVLIEAAMLGKPAIAFSHPGGHHDVLKHQDSGLIVENTFDFAAAIDDLAEDQNLRDRLGNGARIKYEKQFSKEAVMTQLLNVYQGMADRSAVSRTTNP